MRFNRGLRGSNGFGERTRLACRFRRPRRNERRYDRHIKNGVEHSHRREWLPDLLSVRRCVFQLREIVGIVDLENENPALAIGFAVD